MPKQETNVESLKINRGTYEKIQNNLELIGENELIITTDKNIPIPTVSDNGKFIGIENGDYALKTISVPTTTSQLTNDSGFITNTVNNLTNYYTKTEINTMIGNIETLLEALL